jgi:N-methylhydantoinase A
MTDRQGTGEARIRLAIDVGGTFTDVAILDEGQRAARFEKTSTTPDDPARGVIEALAKAGVAMTDVTYFVHGTTLALNALLTRTGATVALVTTRGFRDVYEIGRTDREAMYDFRYQKPPSLVPRRLVFEVDERMDFQGQVRTPFDETDARQVAQTICDAGVQAVAVAFLHSYTDPAHELAMERILEEVAPGVEISLSHRLVREYREYERTSTTVIDAYCKPIVRRYLERLRTRLAEADFGGRFLITRSGGGAMTVETAISQPAHMVLSGPAAGVIGAAAIAPIVDEPDLITIDMGGTSLDASLIVGGHPTTVTEARFEGQAIALPSLNIKTIGAGGGSIAWVDDGGHMHVGPQSAGAMPGPACYGRGGTEATVTDAALLVGYLGERTALGGELTLHRNLAAEAIERLAHRLALPALTVAKGIIDFATARVTGAVREITVEQGHEPAGFALLAYGGGGGLIAADVARELHIPRVIVPPGPGAFSAYGMLMTDVIHDFGQTYVSELAKIPADDLAAILADLETRATEALRDDGFTAETSELLRTVDLRFAGQEHSVAVPLPTGEITETVLADLPERFAVLHEERYGHRMDDPVEMVTARLRAIGRVPRPQLPLAGPGDPEGARQDSRSVHRGAEGPLDYAIYRREALGRGDRIDGPAIAEEHTATTVLHSGDSLVVGEHGELIVSIAPEE